MDDLMFLKFLIFEQQETTFTKSFKFSEMKLSLFL